MDFLRLLLDAKSHLPIPEFSSYHCRPRVKIYIFNSRSLNDLLYILNGLLYFICWYRLRKNWRKCAKFSVVVVSRKVLSILVLRNTFDRLDKKSEFEN